MRTVDLALFADLVAARAAAVEARLERARDRIKQSTLEREARRALAPSTIERLEVAGVLSIADSRAERRDVSELAALLGALRELATWIESRLSEAQEEAGLSADPGGPPGAVRLL